MMFKTRLASALALLTLAGGALAAAPDWLNEAVSAETEATVTMRHELHAMPELGNQEKKTQAYIADVLRRAGVDEVHVGWKDAPTAVIGVLNPGKGHAVGLRADIDALPIKERTGLPYASQAKGVMWGNDVDVSHMCGHDAHMAMLLSAAKILAAHKNEIDRTVVFVFQPAEEGVRGGAAMAASGIVDNVDLLVGAHVGTFCRLGEIGICEGGFLATTKLDVHFTGVPSHAGADPEKGRSALMAACAAAMMFQGIPRSGEGDTRISVGRLVAGEGRNVTPVHATMQLEVRGATAAVKSEAKRS